MSSNREQGLCAPTTVDWATQVGLVERKLKGAIFKAHGQSEPYFRGHTLGITANKSEAHVYSCEAIKAHMLAVPSWARKSAGTWLLVYE